MNAAAIPAVVATEGLAEGLIVRFEDGTCVFYSAALLYRLMPLADVQDEKAEAW